MKEPWRWSFWSKCNNTQYQRAVGGLDSQPMIESLFEFVQYPRCQKANPSKKQPRAILQPIKVLHIIYRWGSDLSRPLKEITRGKKVHYRPIHVDATEYVTKWAEFFSRQRIFSVRYNTYIIKQQEWFWLSLMASKYVFKFVDRPMRRIIAWHCWHLYTLLRPIEKYYSGWYYNTFKKYDVVLVAY